jgi:hypothetical protein
MCMNRAFEVLDDKAIPMNIIPMSPFDVVQISPAYKVSNCTDVYIAPNICKRCIILQY